MNPVCPICDGKLEEVLVDYETYDTMCGWDQPDPTNGHRYYADVVEHTQWHYYNVHGITYYIFISDADRITLGVTIPRGGSLLASIWRSWDFLATDVEFDPKHPGPVIERIRLLETFS